MTLTATSCNTIAEIDRLYADFDDTDKSNTDDIRVDSQTLNELALKKIEHAYTKIKHRNQHQRGDWSW